MKFKLSTTLLAASAILIMGSSCSRKMNLQAAPDISPSQVSIKAGDAVSPDAIPTKVLKRFQQTYGELSSVRWFKSANGFAASFQIRTTSHIIYYKPSGLIDASIHYYFEEQLATPVRQRVNSLFADYSISNVTEVQKNGVTAFYVKIQDATTIKTVKLIGDEWELVESLVKR